MGLDQKQMAAAAFMAAYAYYLRNPADYVQRYGTAMVVRMTYVWKEKIRRDSHGKGGQHQQ